MNLLMTSTAYPPSMGGAQLLMHNLARGMSARHAVQVITQWDTHRTDWLLGTTLNAPAEAKDYQIDGIPVHRLFLPGVKRLKMLPWIFAYYPLQGLALKQIAAILAEEITPWAAQADLVHNCRIGREGLSYASYRIARKYDIPFVLTPVHHPRWGGWLHRYYLRLYRLADAVIALTTAEKDALCSLGVDEQRVFVTGNGPNLAESHDGERFRSRYRLIDQHLILFLGQKYAYKGMAALFESAEIVWQKFPDAHFVFVGPRTTYSRWLFAGCTDKRVLELDVVSLQEKTDALAACDLLCVPSTQESFGGVYTEAWMLGKPVIGADIPAVRSVIDDGHNGYLSDQKPGALAERIIYLLERPQLRAEFGRCGREKTLKYYSWPRLVQKTEQIYEQVSA